MRSIRSPTRAGTRGKGWQDLFSSMVALPNDQRTVIADYLAKNFPEQPAPQAVVIPGDGDGLDQGMGGAVARIASARSARRPRRLDLVDRAMGQRARPARSEDRRDEGVPAEDAAVRPARPGRGQGRQHLVHRQLRRATSASWIRRPARSPNTRCPIKAARDPHTPIFDKNGTLWFTLQGGNMVGRLDPQDRRDQARLRRRRPRTNPYGMVVELEGHAVVRASSAATSCRASIRRRWRSRNTRCRMRRRGPRRIAITSDDVIWYSDYSRGYLGRFDPKTGKAKNGRRRAGRSRSRTASRRSNDVIWYSESAVRPNTLVRFDPEDREVPDVGHSVGRRRRAQHDGDRRAATGAGVQRRQPRRARRDQETVGFHVYFTGE